MTFRPDSNDPRPRPIILGLDDRPLGRRACRPSAERLAIAGALLVTAIATIAVIAG